MNRFVQLLIVALVLLASSILMGCASTKSVTHLQFIPLSSEVFPSIDPGDVKVYSSRLELPGKFIEIGLLKLEGNVPLGQIVSEASKHGADAIIREGNNVTLIRMLEKQTGGKRL